MKAPVIRARYHLELQLTTINHTKDREAIIRFSADGAEAKEWRPNQVGPVILKNLQSDGTGEICLHIHALHLTGALVLRNMRLHFADNGPRYGFLRSLEECLNVQKIPLASLQPVNAKTTYIPNMGLRVVAANKDPQLLIPRLAQGHPFYFEVGMEVPAGAGVGKLYYRAQSGCFTEQHCIKVLLHQGYNRLLFFLDENICDHELRFDPGDNSGEYWLKFLKIFA